MSAILDFKGHKAHVRLPIGPIALNCSVFDIAAFFIFATDGLTNRRIKPLSLSRVAA